MGDEHQEPGGEDALGNTSFYPPPPSVYRRFTKANLLWLDVLRRGVDASDAAWDDDAPAEQRLERQRQVLEGAAPAIDAAALPNFDLQRELLPPNVAWIEEDGGYQLFGQRWPVPEVTPTLEQLGIPRLVPEDGRDKNAAMQTLLRSLLRTYFELTTDLLKPIQPYDVWVPAAPADGPEGERGETESSAQAELQAGAQGETEGSASSEAQAEPQADTESSMQTGSHTQTTQGGYVSSTHIQDRLKHLEHVVINMQYLVNKLRPLQARATLAMVLQSQIDRRRRETQLLRQQSAAVREELARIEFS